MPYSSMDLVELSRMFGIDRRRAERMVQQGEIPSQKVAGQLRFNRAEVAEWLKRNMPSMNRDKLADMDAGITAHRRENAEEPVIIPLLRTETITTQLGARTKNSTLKELVALAQETALVYDGETLLEAIIQREELYSTAMEGGIAIPHPRRPLPYAIVEPILVIARTTQGIGFGAPDGKLTNLFFLTCSQDDRHHLHILARLCRMLHNTTLIENLAQANTTQEILNLMHKREMELIADSL